MPELLPQPTEQPPEQERESPSPGSRAESLDSDQPELETEIPMPSMAPPQIQASEPQGRVLGGRSAAQKPQHLEAYRDTIVVGGDPKREAPPAAPVQHQGQDTSMDQTMAAPQAPPAPRIDQEILAKAQMEAQQMLAEAQAQAQAQAQQMMNDASSQINEQAQAVHQQAQQEGYQAGLVAGQEQGMAESVQRLEQLKMEFVELVLMRRKVLASMESEMVHLAVNVAEKIVGMELATGRDVIAGIVRQGIAILKERDEVVIRVNPAEVEAVKAHQGEYKAMIDGLKRLEVIPDGAIEAGSCSIETNLGNVDARIATQFEAVRQGLDELCKIRNFEKKDKMEAEPVDVPGDPDFHARIWQAEAEAKAAAAAAAAGQH